jgi:glycerol-3-phosphate acyltransferase PlsY
VGVLLGMARGLDIRAHGSRNIGATNVGRVLGRRLGLLCFVLDVLKGALPVLVAGAAAGVLGRTLAGEGAIGAAEMGLWLAVAVAAVVGHMFPLYLRFRGGKGVATGFGAICAMWPLLTVPALVALLVWCAVLRLTRYVSVASMAAAASLPLAYVLWIVGRGGGGRLLEQAPQRIAASWPPLAVTAALALLIVYRHRANIGRLRRGQEPRIGGTRG